MDRSAPSFSSFGCSFVVFLLFDSIEMFRCVVFSHSFRTISAFHCLIQWFPPDTKDPLSIVNFLIFWLWPVIIFYNYFRAIFIGPGKNEIDENHLELFSFSHQVSFRKVGDRRKKNTKIFFNIVRRKTFCFLSFFFYTFSMF